jgi:hypothetical protein
MQWIVSALALLVLAASSPGSSPADTQTAATLLAQARVALGGDAALAAVKTFTARGTIALTLGDRTMPGRIAFDAILPDRFLRTMRRTMDRGPFGSAIVTDYEGFAVDEPIREMLAPDMPVPMILRGPEPATPEAAAAARERQLRARQRRFVPLLLALFAESPAVYPLTFSTIGRLDLPTGAVDVVEVLDVGSGAWRLFLDHVTHLPSRLTWMSGPMMGVAVQSTASVNRATGEVVSRSNPPLLPANPTAGMPDVEWAVDFSDYRDVDGLRWPYRIVQTIDDAPHEDIRIRTFAINPEIDLKVFDVGR